MLMRELERDGFVGERVGEPATQQSESTEAAVAAESTAPLATAVGTTEIRTDGADRLSIELPKDGMTPAAMENLRRLVASKATLLKRALGTDSLPIIEYEDRIAFAWFYPTNEQAEVVPLTMSLTVDCVIPAIFDSALIEMPRALQSSTIRRTTASEMFISRPPTLFR